MAARLDALTDPYLAALALRRRRTGHLLLSPSNTEPGLYQWAVRQRSLWQRKELAPKLEARLRAIGFPLDTDDCGWELGIAYVCRSLERWGALPTPWSFGGRWLEGQRALLGLGRLTPKREARLRKLGALP